MCGQDDDDETVMLVRVDGNNNVRLALTSAALDLAGVDVPSQGVVIAPSANPGHVQVTVSAAGARFLADWAGLPPDPDLWPSKLHGISSLVAGAVPFASARIEDERRNGQRRRVAIYSSDLARSQGESLDQNRQRYGGSSAPSKADPAVYQQLASNRGDK